MPSSCESGICLRKEDSMRRLPFLSLMLVLLLAHTGLSQSSKGILTGHVTDKAGAVLQGAQIQLTPSAGTIVSDVQGDFIVPNLAPGSYEVKISFVGFTPFA